MPSIVLFVVIQAQAKLLESEKTLTRRLSESFLLLSTLPMMIQLSAKSTSFVSEILVRSENN